MSIDIASRTEIRIGKTLSRLVWFIILIFAILTSGRDTRSVAGAGHFPGPVTPSAEEPVEIPRTPLRSEHATAGTSAPTEGSIIEPDLRRALMETAPGETIRAIVHLREGPMDAQAASRARLVSALQAAAERSQAPLIAHLEEAKAAGLVSSYTPFWITNAIAVRARPSVIHALAADPAVAAVRLDHYRRWIADEGSKLEFQGQDPRLAIRHSSFAEWNVAHIRAPEVWSSLHISGTGAVVAGMDTGVDWLHPALQANYRGYNPHGPANHTYSWYDATEAGALYPVDGHGHGSHTLGTAVGADGIGVAPGARWIGVKVLNNQGYGYDSWIHAGFQWLLAPGGDPARAPDVVNCSWGNDNGYLTIFERDLRALRAAGILAVFANGNNGPGSGSVDSPASLPEAFAVGAIDEHDRVAGFSSRGPSPWGEIRPHVAAPGVHVRSSSPGGAYRTADGTSSAAPHVSGMVAMLRSVSPTLSITRTAFVITSTAVPLGDPVPNNDAGWGRVDAFSAVAAVAHPGFISGTVSQASTPESETSHPIAGATITAVPHGGGGGGADTTEDDGAYLLALAPDVYDLRVSAFGHEPSTAWGVPVDADTTTARDFALIPKPAGSLRVRVVDAYDAQPVTATIAVLDTPYEVVTHTHTFDLPADTYTVRAHRLGYRVVTATAAVTVGETTAVDLALPRAPSILLVDSGGWYYESQAPYFRQALEGLAYTHDEWAIRRLPDDVPAAADLRPYEIVIWSAPRDAPGYIGAGEALADYLDGGGRLVLSGQDVGFWDGGGAIGYWSAYYQNYLKTILVGDDAPTRELRGLEDDIFDGLEIGIAGPGGADNQDYPDVVAVADPDAAAPVMAYEYEGGTQSLCGGVRVGTCLPYRVVYLSFGFEAINDRLERREVMGRALDWLTAPPPTVGLDLTPETQLRIGTPGSVVTHALRVRHVGQGGVTDEVDLSLEGVSWRTELSDASLPLTPCTSATVVVSVTVPATATWHVRDVVTLTARSSLSPALALSATLTSKAPAPILLVDDDRWYEQQEVYRAAMEGAGLPYDLWQINQVMGWEWDQSPSVEILQRYPVVVWWTGYDWYAPVTDDEEASLEAYLDGGGRLFLSSQDYLYYHGDGDDADDAFSRDYLGVLTYTESVTPTHVVGVPEDPVGGGLGPWPLSYPRGYQNWSDGVLPTPDTAVAFRDQNRRGTALARRADAHATLFLPFPFEALPEEVRPTAMARAVGWLSWLGRSTFEADRRSVAPGETLTYTFALRNDGPQAVTAALSNTLPAALAIDVDSVTGPGGYDPPSRRLSWSGVVEPGQVMTLTYRAAVVTGTVPGSLIVNPARIDIEDHRIHFGRSASVRAGAPDLSPSSFGCAPSLARPGATVTCTLALVNAGPGDAAEATAAIRLPGNVGLAGGSLSGVDGVTISVPDSVIRWTGPLGAGERFTLTYGLGMPGDPVHPPLYSVAFLEDGTGGAWERPTWVVINPRRVYLPLVCRSAG